MILETRERNECCSKIIDRRLFRNSNRNGSVNYLINGKQCYDDFEDTH